MDLLNEEVMAQGAMRAAKKKAPCHMKFTVNVHTVQANLRFLKWMRRILHQKFSLPNQLHQTQNDQH